MRRLLLSILSVSLIVYVFFGLFLFVAQRSMMYFPTTQNFDDCVGFVGYDRLQFEGTRYYFKNASSEDVIVLYHGNAGSACDRSYYSEIFEQTNASLLFVEYAGYSNDSLQTSKDSILKDVSNIHKLVSDSYSHITIYGESIGTGAASYHAYLGDVDVLILTSPFSSIVDVAQSAYVVYPASILVTEDFDNVEYLSNYSESLYVFHGDSDQVIDYRFSEKLFHSVPTEDGKYFLIEKAGHNDLWSSDFFKERLSSMLARE